MALKTTSIVDATAAFVKGQMETLEGSHDFHHIMRVHNVALKLAEAEQLDDDTREIVQLAALLHDIADWKYSGSETAGAEAAETFLVSHDYPRDKVEIIKTIILGISYHSELGGKIEMFPALAVVQDADRLDAIGAVGIARCFAYGGSRGRPLYDPSCPPSEAMTKEEYMAQKNSPSVNHFYEKLLKLKGMMKTNAGRTLAEKRHAFMQTFLAQFFLECEGDS